jgi:hypothetical protein
MVLIGQEEMVLAGGGVHSLHEKGATLCTPDPSLDEARVPDPLTVASQPILPACGRAAQESEEVFVEMIAEMHGLSDLPVEGPSTGILLGSPHVSGPLPMGHHSTGEAQGGNSVGFDLNIVCTMEENDEEMEQAPHDTARTVLRAADAQLNRDEREVGGC